MGSMAWLPFVRECWKKIPSPALSLSFAIGAAQLLNCFATTALGSGSSPAGYRKVVFAGGQPAQTHHYTRLRRSSSPFCSTTACLSRPALLPVGASFPAQILRRRALLPRIPGNSTANKDADSDAHPIYSE